MFNLFKSSAWEKYKKALKAKFPDVINNLNNGASDNEINLAEKEINVKFPEQLRALYRENNGDNSKMLCGAVMGFHFYSLNEIVSNYNDWKNVYEDYIKDPSAFDEFQDSEPDGYIKKQYVNLKWIPICDDAAGNHIGIDLDPDKLGKVGQIINFGRDEENKIVIAHDLNSFIERMTRIVNSSHFALDEYDGEKVIVLNTSKTTYSHFIDYLKSGEAVK